MLQKTKIVFPLPLQADHETVTDKTLWRNKAAGEFVDPTSFS
jgi:hypothetical protein